MLQLIQPQVADIPLARAACDWNKPFHRRARAACGWDKPSHSRSSSACGQDKPSHRRSQHQGYNASHASHAINTSKELVMWLGLEGRGLAAGDTGDERRSDARASESKQQHSRRARRRTEAVDVLWPSAGSRAACLPKLAPAAVIRPPAIWSHRALSSPGAAGPARAPAAPRAARRVAVVRSVPPASDAPCPPASKALVLSTPDPGPRPLPGWRSRALISV